MTNRPKWLIPVAIAVGILLIVVLPLIGSYNKLVSREATVDQAFADLDVQLQRRNDLVPGLVNSVKAALKQEQAVFVEIARARARYGSANTVSEKDAANGQLEAGLGRLIAIVESNPNLKSNENIADLMTQLEGTENRVAQARRDYNAAVTPYNVYIRRFPRSLWAGMFGFDHKPLFQSTPEERQAPDVNLDSAFTSPAPTG